MILIGENLNVISQILGPALKERNAGPIQEMVKAETAAGVDLFALNIGPARKGGDELTAQEYNADLIGLLWSNEVMPRDVNERAMHTVDFVYKANAAGIPNERIWIDSIASPVSVEINQVKACVEFMTMLGEIAPGCKSTVGLSNVSNGAPDKLRCWLNRTYMIMLMRYGLYSAIVDAFDKDLMAIARGQRQDIVELVHKMMDGEKPDISSMPKEMANYARTVRVLMGESLYSHSWLEV